MMYFENTLLGSSHSQVKKRSGATAVNYTVLGAQSRKGGRTTC